MKIDILSIFPEFISSFKNWSMIKKGLDSNLYEINNIDIRNYTKDKHNKVDDYPFGGGPGMLMTPEPLDLAIKDNLTEDSKVIFLSPKGKVFNQQIANNLVKEKHLIFISGHYEGIDQRIIDKYVDMEISIGDFVTTGGELPTMIIVDSLIRLIPGLLASDESIEEESHYNGLLEHPQYTRPREYKGIEVPEVLLSGNHKLIENWKKEKSLIDTFEKRPDLLEDVKLSYEEREILKKYIENKYCDIF